MKLSIFKLSSLLIAMVLFVRVIFPEYYFTILVSFLDHYFKFIKPTCINHLMKTISSTFLLNICFLVKNSIVLPLFRHSTLLSLLHKQYFQFLIRFLFEIEDMAGEKTIAFNNIFFNLFHLYLPHVFEYWYKLQFARQCLWQTLYPSSFFFK